MNNRRKYKNYIHWGVTAFLVIAASIAVGYLVLRFEKVKGVLGQLLNILAPVIYGAVMAYLLTPVYNWCILHFTKPLEKALGNEKRGESLSRGIGTLASLFLLLFVVVGLISMLIPQLITSIQSVTESLPTNISNSVNGLEKLLNDNPELRATVMNYLQQALDMAKNWGKTVLAPNLDKVFASVSTGMFSVLIWLKNVIIGLIVMVYLLNMKDSLVTIAKKITYSLLPISSANRLITETRRAHQIFGGFIIGKILDSLIIGVICFFCMQLMRMPYALLISVIIGVTNVIPFFGPFIGAVPAGFLILLENPMQCLYFLGFILILQQFDGNILGPKILGESTGVSSFWVLFSILLFGGLFGFVGMIIGVPTFAVIYGLTSDFVKASLRKKELPVSTSDYEDLSFIEEESRRVWKHEEEDQWLEQKARQEAEREAARNAELKTEREARLQEEQAAEHTAGRAHAAEKDGGMEPDSSNKNN